MKRILSLALSAVMIATSIPFAYATNNYDQGTKVEYTATNNENYTITVPALLQPGQSGNVNLEGSWAENRVITVTADKTVTLTNSIKSSDTKVLDIYFEGISEKGNNTKTQTFTESVSVKSIDSLAFSYCPNLTTVIIEEGVVNLGTVGGPSGSIFQDCRKLSYVNIPKSVTVIGDSTFNKCTSLGVFYNGSIDDWHAIAFDDTWNIGCNEISVVCSDGTITIPAYGK